MNVKIMVKTKKDLNLEKKIERHWDTRYKKEFTPWESGKPTEYLVKLIKTKKLKKGKALDLGSGLGTQSFYLAEKGFDVTGLDISKTAITSARKNARKLDLKCKFVLGNAYDLKFKDNMFDFILDRGCFHHIPPKLRDKYVEGVLRVLKKNGKYLLFAFSERNTWTEKTFSLSQLKTYFGTGFKFLSTKQIPRIDPGEGGVSIRAVFMKKK